MAITLYQKEDFKGTSLTVSKDYSDLRTTSMGKDPSSMKMTSTSDAICLFKDKDWKGTCLYKRSTESINDLGKSSDGGKFGFGDTIESVRVTPFTLTLNFNVLRNNDGDLPTKWANTAACELSIERILTYVNSLMDDSKTLIDLAQGDIHYRTDDEHYNLTDWERLAFPLSWKEEGCIDVIIINQFDKVGTVGYGKFPCLGNYVVVAVRGQDSAGTFTELTNEDMAAILIHEIGHYLGLTHSSADSESDNFMYDTMTAGRGILALKMKEDQISDIHTALASNLFRKEDRS